MAWGVLGDPPRCSGSDLRYDVINDQRNANGCCRIDGPKMKETDIDQDAILDIARKVVAMAARAKFDLTPEAYSVWYAFYCGNNRELVAEIERILASGVAFTQVLHEELCRRFLGEKGAAQVMEQVQKQTQSLLAGVLGDLLAANQDTAQFGGRLGEYARQIKEATRLADIQAIMKNLLRDTAAMAASSKKLEGKLAEATRQAEELRSKLRETEEQAMRDALTGLHNRKAFDQQLAHLIREFRQEGRYFSVLFADIDFFKRFNDIYGHAVGDLVLRKVGNILRRGVKGSDFPARYGGEEFVILLPATVLENAIIVAEQLRVKISVKKPQNPETGEVYDRITASFGVAQVRPGDKASSVMARADKALYLAKESGRNNVKTELDLPDAELVGRA